ncbi:hypothetical protein ENINMM108B2_03195 [Enterobacter intestinihominis]
MTDTRNWKCFFGMHAWQTTSQEEVHYVKKTGELPTKITTKYKMRCLHCGKHRHEEH